mmetsp:Transcript_37030/g.88018  ORF Transcript_37030/g.88018 Transcript_37030/m.88018 type:complete len:86 (-) Transcript_37030:161-418(-)
MSQARHVGKIVVHTEDTVCSDRLHKGSVVVSGGMGMLGSLVAGWLAEYGVRSFKLLGRSGKASGGKQTASKTSRFLLSVVHIPPD